MSRLFSVALLAAAACRGEDLTLELLPSPVTVLPSYAEVNVVVRLKNTSSSALHNARLSWLTNDGFQVSTPAASTADAAPGASVIWRVTIAGINRSHLPGTIVFLANGVLAGGARRDAAASLAVSTQPDGGARAIEATMEGAFDAVTQNRPGEGALTLTNNLDTPLRAEFHPRVPADVFQAPQLAPVSVPPRSSVLVPVHLVAQSSLTPGAYPVAIGIEARWDAGGHQEQRLLVVSKTATAGVFFESELLKALSVPTILLLPGCLIIFTFQLLVSFGWLKLKDLSRLPVPAIADPGFWVIAVTLSGIFAGVYSLIRHRNYLVRYGPDDLEMMWMSSIMAGVGCFLLAAWLARSHCKRHVPGRDDKPEAVLDKMANNGLGLAASRAKFTLGGREIVMFVAETIEDGQTMVWVAPAIQVRWQDSDAGRKADGEFRALVNSMASPASVAGKIRDGVNSGLVTRVAWVPGSIPNPYHLKIENITGWESPDRIVEAGAAM